MAKVSAPLVVVAAGYLLASTANGAPPAGEIDIAGTLVRYDSARDQDLDQNGKPEQRAYYLGDKMVAAAFDNTRDGSFDTWVRFGEDQRVASEAVDQDGDGAPDRLQAMDAKGRPSGKPSMLEGAAKVTEHALADAAAPTQDNASYDPELKAWRSFPLDWRLWAGLGLLGLTLIPVGLSLRKR